METIIDDQSNLAPRGGEAVTELVRQFPETPVLLLLSGGSALGLIEHIDAEAFGEHVTLSVLDERFNVEENDSNFAQLAASSMCERARERGANLLDPRGIEGEGLDETANWFDMSLRSWRNRHPDGVILCTQGIGADGHTAGILPMADDQNRFNQLFVATDRFAVGYEVPGDEPAFSERLTVTEAFLRRQITSSVVYATGGNKREVLERIIHGDDRERAAFPAGVIGEMNDVLILTDQAIEQGK